MSNASVARARQVVGVRFRAQGRRADDGLDCLGVVSHAFGLAESAGRANYRLSGEHEVELRAALVGFFDEIRASEVRAGDAILCRVAARQLHLAVCCGSSFVHADAAIGRVVETPWPPRWPIISAYRWRAGGGHVTWQP